MRSLSRSILWVVLAFFVASLLFSFLLETQTTKPIKLNLGEVAQKVTAGKVSSIVISGQEVKLTLNDGTEAVSRKEGEVSL